MEKKTMGSFLAALRRANGMTQKELAERLNVSDKSVSRWERDDGAPDLALIPVIAEVFGVTCDELLRGERAAAGEEQGAQSTPKGEQQKKHLLAASLSRFRSRCCIALALAAAGFLVAMAFNSALDRALLGFFLGAVFFVAAAAVETVQLNAALLAIHDEEGEDVDAFRRAVVRGAERTYGAAWVLFACTLPLLLAFHPVTINGFTASRTGVGISLDFLAGSAGSAYRSCHRRTCCAARRAAAGEKEIPPAGGENGGAAQKRQAPAYYGAHALRGAGAERLCCSRARRLRRHEAARRGRGVHGL